MKKYADKFLRKVSTLRSCMTSKLKQTAGDSLAEAMVAFAIAALGTVLLVTMITSATNVIGQNKVTIEKAYQSEVNVAGKSNARSDSAAITGGDLGGNYNEDVFVYSDGEFNRYEPKVTP